MMFAKQDSLTEKNTEWVSTPLGNEEKCACLFVHTPLKGACAVYLYFTFQLIFPLVPISTHAGDDSSHPFINLLTHADLLNKCCLRVSCVPAMVLGAHKPALTHVSPDVCFSCFEGSSFFLFSYLC